MATLDKNTARYERRATVNFLRRLVKSTIAGKGTVEEIRMASFILDWELKRQARYDKRPGGL